MTDKDFEFITDKIGIWFANLKLKSFRHTFDGDTYPSSALVTDYELFIAKLKKDIEFIPEEPVSEGLEEAALVYSATDIITEDGKLVIDSEKVNSFKAGAKWQKQNTIAEATAFLIKHRNFIAFSDTFIEDFGKCLEDDSR